MQFPLNTNVKNSVSFLDKNYEIIKTLIEDLYFFEKNDYGELNFWLNLNNFKLNFHRFFDDCYECDENGNENEIIHNTLRIYNKFNTSGITEYAVIYDHKGCNPVFYDC